jgi:hypothetical protein
VQNAQTSPPAGASVPSLTSTSDPDEMDRPMEDPETGSHRSSASDARRSPPASTEADIRGLGPLGVSFTGVDPRWEAAVDQAIGRLGARPGPASIDLRVGERVDRPSGPAVELYPGTSIWPDGSGLTLHAPAQGLWASSSGSVLRLETGAAGDAVPDLRTALPPVLAAALGVHDVFLVHGGIVFHDGGAVLIVGPTGAGKSTSVAAARAAGWRIGGDDLVVAWKDEDATWLVSGLPRPVRVERALLTDAADVVSGEPDDRGRVTPEGWLVPDAAPLVGSVLPARSEADGHLRTADGLAVAVQVMSGSFAAATPAAAPLALAFSAAVGRLPAWELGLSADPARRLARAADALAAIARS